MRYTVIVPRVGGMFPFVNSLGLDGDYIYKSCNNSSVSQWMQLDVFRGQTLMGG